MKKTEVSGFSAKDWYERGQGLTQDGRHREAIEALDRAIAINPACAEAYFARGSCYYTLGRYDLAGDDIDAAAILGCRDAQFWSKHSIPPLTIRADDRQE
jgi:tetratricopeptide (TPR) repeat protein